MWLRGWWYLLTDGAVTDVQNGGLTMVSGGGYTRSDVPQGFWNLSRHNLYVGNTQPNQSNGVPANPAASNAGPLNPFNIGLSCTFNGAYCVLPDDGTMMFTEALGNSQRLINIYDGPTYQDSDAFKDISVTDIGTLNQCKPGGNNVGSCTTLGWSNAFGAGVLQSPATNNPSNRCVLPNAAISWKQPNGFYYPPAFHEYNLAFENVDLRHYVVEPLWLPGTFMQDAVATTNTYCTWEPDLFVNFTDVDRQTELTDDMGSLTGLASGTAAAPGPTTVVNNDPFFNAPLSVPECSSSAPNLTGTATTSPYEYVTTAIFPSCGGFQESASCVAEWGNYCSTQQCYGVPLYRQYLTDAEYNAYQTDPTKRPVMRMMGQSGGQRSNMTLNHGSFYVDTTVPQAVQNVPNTNVFLAGQTYWVYFIYAKPTLHQIYSFYIGQVSQTEAAATITSGYVDVTAGTTPTFTAGTKGQPDWIIQKQYDSNTGVLSVTVDLGAQATVFDNDRPKFCQPANFCSVNSAGVCGCAPNSNCTEDAVCGWATKEIDCPLAGCFGFALTLPEGFSTAPVGQPIPAPPPIHFVGDTGSDPYFNKGNIVFNNVPSSIAGSCTYAAPPEQSNLTRLLNQSRAAQRPHALPWAKTAGTPPSSR